MEFHLCFEHSTMIIFSSMGTGIFGLWDSTKQCEKSLSSLESKYHLNGFYKGIFSPYFSLLTLNLIQAAYKVGGQIVSAGTIQNSILGCRISRPGQVDTLRYIQYIYFVLSRLLYL